MEEENKKDILSPREYTEGENAASEYMKKAIELARQVAEKGDVPIGAVLVYDGLKRESPMGVLFKPCRTFRDSGGLRKNRRLASGGLHALCKPGALPNVCRSHFTS